METDCMDRVHSRGIYAVEKWINLKLTLVKLVYSWAKARFGFVILYPRSKDRGNESQ